MQAVSFGGLAGWLHDAPGDTLVLMCGAQGYEDLCTQRGWHDLAEMLCARGFRALRFDYAGCGDSLGSDTDPAQVAAWLGSIRQAVAFARGELGARRVVLAGLRLGGLLAAETCLQDAEIAGLVLLGAPASGRAYAREMQVLASVVGVPPDDAAPWPPLANGFELGGHRYTAETLAALPGLARRDDLLMRLVPRPCLVLAPGNAATPDETGSPAATGAPFEGYESFVIDRIFSRTPVADWMRAADWLVQTWPPDSARAAPLPPLAQAEISGGDFTERRVQFGPDNALAAVLCQPRGVVATGVFILANTGANHHIGWGRGTVEMARALAAGGVASLRIDAAGLGDSRALAGRITPPVYALDAVADVTTALDWLAAQGFQRFGIAGICSGAHLAFHAAVADKRLASFIAVNLNRFDWPAGLRVEDAVRNVYRSSRAYARKAADPRTLLRLVRGELDVRGIARALASRVRQKLRTVFARRAASADAHSPRSLMRQLAGRKTQALFIYGSQDAGLDEISLQFGSPQKLAAMPGAEFALVHDADHNFSPHWARAELCRLVVQFATQPRTHD